MQKHNIKVGSTYIVKVSGTLAKVRLTREHPRGGWYGTNLATGREIRIRTAARLRSEAKPAGERGREQIRNPRLPDFSADELQPSRRTGQDRDPRRRCLRDRPQHLRLLQRTARLHGRQRVRRGV